MEAETGFSYFLTTQEIQIIYHYLRSTVGWLCLSTGNWETSCETHCHICDIWKRYKNIYLSKALTNFEKRVFIKRMFRSQGVDKEFPYFCSIFKDMKKIKNHD